LRLKILLLIVIVSVCGISSHAQISRRRLESDFVLKAEKTKYLHSLEERILNTFGGKPPVIREKKWDKLFYELSVDLYRSPHVKKALKIVLNKIDDVSENLSVRAILTARALYPHELENEVYSLFERTERLNAAVYAFHYLYLNNRKKYRPYLRNISRRFGNDSLLVRLTYDYVNESEIFYDDDALREIFSPDFLKGELVILTVLRSVRKIPGLTLIRKPDGAFLFEGDSLWAISQLGYSVTDFPYYLLDGNTPQGLYLFDGFYQSKKKSIGPTPVPIIRLPFEVSPKKFLRKNGEEKWNKELYADILPKALGKFNSTFEAYYAGKLGRKLLVMHGSTDNPALYKNEKYFPLTPSTGCLTSYEKWDEKTGKLLESDQLKLVNAILKLKKKRGYLFVFELNDKNEKLTKAEIMNLISRLQKIGTTEKQAINSKKF
jgi:hypothetical protein